MTGPQVVKGGLKLAHSEEVVAIHDRILAESPSKGRYIKVGGAVWDGCRSLDWIAMGSM